MAWVGTPAHAPCTPADPNTDDVESFVPTLDRGLLSTTGDRSRVLPGQAARTAEQRRQRRSCISERLGSGPWHFSQRISRRTLWCERQAPVDSFTAWRVQPSQIHFPNVIVPPRAARTCAAPCASEMPR